MKRSSRLVLLGVYFFHDCALSSSLPFSSFPYYFCFQFCCISTPLITLSFVSSSRSSFSTSCSFFSSSGKAVQAVTTTCPADFLVSFVKSSTFPVTSFSISYGPSELPTSDGRASLGIVNLTLSFTSSVMFRNSS